MEYKKRLESYRNKIDILDWELLSLLQKRFEISKKIWAIKKENNLKVLDTKRWSDLIENLKTIWVEKYSLNKDFIEIFWENIHEESQRLQE